MSFKFAQLSFWMGCIQQHPLVLDDGVRPALSSVRIILTLSVMYRTHHIFKDFICVSTCSNTFMHAFPVHLLLEISMGPGGKQTGSF
jgi:hypothetical protein